MMAQSSVTLAAELLNLPPQLLLLRSLHNIGLTQFLFLRVVGHTDSPSLTGRQKLSVVMPFSSIIS